MSTFRPGRNTFLSFLVPAIVLFVAGLIAISIVIKQSQTKTGEGIQILDSQLRVDTDPLE